MRSPYSCTPVLTGRASRVVDPRVPTVADISRARQGLGTLVLLDERSDFDAQRGKLIETDLHLPYLDGLTAPLDRGAHPAGAVPPRPSPRAAILSATARPALHCMAADATPITCDSLPSPRTHSRRTPLCHGGERRGRGSRPSQPSGSSRPHDPARIRLPASGRARWSRVGPVAGLVRPTLTLGRGSPVGPAGDPWKEPVPIR